VCECECVARVSVFVLTLFLTWVEMSYLWPNRRGCLVRPAVWDWKAMAILFL